MKILLKYVNFPKDSDGRYLGITSPDGRNILIQRGLRKRERFEVMCHEFTHAAIIHCGIRASDKKHEQVAKKVGCVARDTLLGKRK